MTSVYTRQFLARSINLTFNFPPKVPLLKVPCMSPALIVRVQKTSHISKSNIDLFSFFLPRRIAEEEMSPRSQWEKAGACFSALGSRSLGTKSSVMADGRMGAVYNLLFLI